MTSFSSLEFDKLFNATGNDKIVYYTDKIYGYKDFNTGFKDMVNIADYLKPITKLMVNKYNKDVINQIIDGTLNVLSNPPKSDNKNWERGSGDILVMNYASSDSLTTEVAVRIYDDMIQTLGDPKDQSVKNSFAQVATDHRVASNFMENVILSMCKWKYENAKSKLLLELADNKEMISDVIDAGNELKMMGTPKEASILANLHTTSSEAIRLLIKDQAPSTYRLDGFVEGSSFHFNKFRTTLREVMFKNLVLREYAGNKAVPDQVLMYLRRLLVELYIISYYPYIHFQYITELLNKFKQTGNFINMRVAALVRVAFSINMLLWYYQESAPKLSGTSSIAKHQVVVSEWAETLKNYMTALSRVDFKNKDATIQNVIADLHSLSSKVSSQSLSIDELKENITASQMQVRSILSRLTLVNKERSKKITQYSILVSLLLIVVVVSAVLLIFNMFKNYLLYGLVGICSVIIVYNLILSIMDLVKTAQR